MKYRPRNFYTSDLHLGHHNILKSEPGLFADVDDRDNLILGNLAQDLRRGDTLWVLGDVAFTKLKLELLFATAAATGFKMNLVRGNHDDKLAWRQRDRFDAYYEAHYQKLQTAEQEKHHLYLSHYGCRVWRNSHHGALHLYGHSHGNLPGHGRSMDVGVMLHDYRPLSEEAVLGMLLPIPYK